jgi:hypothetical protein
MLAQTFLTRSSSSRVESGVGQRISMVSKPLTKSTPRSLGPDHGGGTARKCRLFYLSVLGLGQGAEGGHVVVVESGSLLAYLEQVRVVITEIFIVATSYTTK